MSGKASPTTPARMFAQVTEQNRSWWLDGDGQRLLAAHCGRCVLWVPPTEADCPECGGQLEPRPVSGEGTVYTYTVNFHPFNPEVPLPYVIAIVELIEQAGLRIATNIIDCEADSVYVGMPVEVQFERHDRAQDTVYFPVFVPRSRQAHQRRLPDVPDVVAGGVPGDAPR